MSFYDDNVRGSKPMNVDDVFDINKDEQECAYGIKSASTAISSLPQYISTVDNLQVRPEFIVFRPFYTIDYLNRLSNAYLFDDVIHTALERLSYFVMGTTDEFRSTLYPDTNRELKSELEAKNLIKQIQIQKKGLDIAGSIISTYLTDQEIEDFETYIHRTDRICKLGRYLKKNFIASHVFGRSASYIEYTEEGIPTMNIPPGSPIAIKPLKPMYLGNIAIDKDSWVIKALEYRDPKLVFKEYVDVTMQNIAVQSNDQLTPGRYIDANSTLYFVRNNNNTMLYEDDFWFGHSTLQSVLPISEENRRINRIVIPQLNQAHWAGTGIWHFPNWSKSMMNQFFSELKPGGHIAVPQKEISFQETKLTYDYTGIINLKNEMKKHMLSVFNIPSFLMNFENITNRATAEMVTVGFNESTIQAERSWITDILDEQWYPKLFKVYYPDDEFIDIKLKMMSDFNNIQFESFLEKSVAIAGLIDKGLITLTEGRNMLKLPAMLPEDYQELGIAPPKTATDEFSTLGDTGVPNLTQELLKTQSPSGGQSQKLTPALIKGVSY